LHVLRSHCLSLISAVVIAGLFVFAMTSDAFQDSGRSAGRAYTLSQRDLPPGEDIGLQYVQSIAWTPPTAELHLRSLVYYVFENEADSVLFQTALISLTRSRFYLTSVSVEETHFFIVASTPEEQIAADRLLATAAADADTQGFLFQVQDMRPQP
jgi:hypothetical protein